MSGRRALLGVFVAGVILLGALARGPGVGPAAASGLASSAWYPLSAPMSMPMSGPMGGTHALATPGPSLAPQTVTFVLPAEGPLGTTIDLTGRSSSGLPVAYRSLTLTTCTVDGATLHLVGMGTCTVEASQPGTSDAWAAAPPVQATLSVLPPEN